MWALFTHSRGELFTRLPVRDTPRHPLGLPCSPRSRLSPRCPSPPPPGPGPAGRHRLHLPRRVSERTALHKGNISPGPAGAVSLSPGAEPRVPGIARPARGAASRCGAGRAARTAGPRSPRSARPGPARHSGVGKGAFGPRAATPARKINAKGCHSTSWREKRSQLTWQLVHGWD